jgi:hypothetical protein
MGLFFWASIKDIVYSESIQSSPDLRRSTGAHIAAMPVDVLSGCAVKWNFVSTSVRPSMMLTLNCNKW